ncbi:siderophore-iron reductase FhuF [Atlantibacter hermannii]|uniref:siderophore-iron reductase FhuF n=1 Tax=Atlantibacter hermannii TaxID=565 RepID=UPI002801D52F|nr:siderophore-iron reductase FhuF [Atlantibacter hermannii]MDQ7881962.1 siderophore-iron reductase FhuF [Atlantibacter hermannii]
MAYSSFQLIQGAVPSPASFGHATSLADALRHDLRLHHPHLLETVKFDEPTPFNALTLAQWAQPDTFNALMAAYGDHIYAQHTDQPRETKPLKSLWAQWYIGLLTPALMAAVVMHPTGLRLSPDLIRVRFHETGRAETFWIDVYPHPPLAQYSLRERMEYLTGEVLRPVVDALEESGDINGRLIWSNAGYLIYWFLGELKPRLGEADWQALRQACFFEKTRLDGRDNPLYRTVVPREGLLVRRTCCQRNRLPGVQQCGDCTLK